MLTGKNWNTWRMTCPNSNLSTTNPTWTDLGLNLGLCGKRLESNQLCDGMDVDLSGISVMGININAVSQYWNVLPLITLPSLIWQNVAIENIESKNFSPLLRWLCYSSWYFAVKCSFKSQEREICYKLAWKGDPDHQVLKVSGKDKVTPLQAGVAQGRDSMTVALEGGECSPALSGHTLPPRKALLLHLLLLFLLLLLLLWRYNSYMISAISTISFHII